MKFSEWLKIKTEMVGTGVVYDPNVKHRDFNVWGAPGGVGGVTIQGDPIKSHPHPHKKRKKK